MTDVDIRTFVYLCPGCLSIERHVGSMLSLCKDVYGRWGRPKCETWTVAIAWKDNQPLKGSHLQFLPDQPRENRVSRIDV